MFWNCTFGVFGAFSKSMKGNFVSFRSKLRSNTNVRENQVTTPNWHRNISAKRWWCCHFYWTIRLSASFSFLTMKTTVYRSTSTKISSRFQYNLTGVKLFWDLNEETWRNKKYVFITRISSYQTLWGCRMRKARGEHLLRQTNLPDGEKKIQPKPVSNLGVSLQIDNRW